VTHEGLTPGTATDRPGPALPAREVRYSPPIWRQWNLVWNFAQRDLKSKFKGAALGWAWSLVVPLATLGIYTVVFSVVFRAEPPDMGNGNEGIFVVFLFAGLTAWTFFSSTINAGISGLIGTGALLKKIYFPSYAPVLGAGVAVGVQSLIELGIYVVVLAFLGNLGWTFLLVPVWAALFAVFSAALATTFAILNVYMRDLAHLVAIGLQLLFYATPIIYPLTLVPESVRGFPLRAVIEWSPISQFVHVFRDITYGLSPGAWTSWLGLLGWTLAALALSSLVYKRRGGDLGEEL
jgi:ABC-type polysaccharide/polyol phosphate export permease